MLQIKICGYREILPKSAWDGVDLVGINHSTTSHRYVNKNMFERLLGALPARVQTVLVTQNMDLGELLNIQNTYRFDWIQLHGEESENHCKIIQETGCKVIKACNYKNYTLHTDHHSDLLLIDGEKPGSGESYNYQNIQLNRAFFIAGGINSDTIGRIPRLPHLSGIDVASGAEYRGKTSERKIQELVQILKSI